MNIPSNGITPEVIRDAMPPYHLSPDLLAATIATLPPPPPDATPAWREARLTRLFGEIVALRPADATQARIAAQLLTTRELADTFTADALVPGLPFQQKCRLARTMAELQRSADRLERTLARRQQMPVSFYGTVIEDEVDIPALAATWGSPTPPAAATGARQSPAALNSSAGPDRVAPKCAANPPPNAKPTPAPARATPPAPPPNPADAAPPAPSPAPPHHQAPPDESPDPATQPDRPPATPLTRPAGANWVFEQLDQGPGWSREVLLRRTPADPLPEPAT